MLYLKIIKAVVYDANVSVFFINKCWINIREGRGQPLPQNWESASDGFRELGQNYWHQYLKE